MTDSAPVPAREPQLIPVVLLRCGMEAPGCGMSKGVVVRMEAGATVRDIFARMRAGGLHLVTPKGNGHLHATIPLDDFLPDRPVLITPICSQCLQVAKANNMIDGEV